MDRPARVGTVATTLPSNRHVVANPAVPAEAACARGAHRIPTAARAPADGLLEASLAAAATAAALHRLRYLRTSWPQRSCVPCRAVGTTESRPASSSVASAGQLCGSVFLWQTPLKLPSPLPGRLAELLPKHSVVLAESAAGDVVAFDFEPEDKDSLSTALQLLTGGAAPGRFGVKRLRQLPRGAMRVGPVRAGTTVEEVAEDFNAAFNPNLSLSSNDCNSYSRAVLSRILAEPENEVGNRLYSTLDLEVLQANNEAVYKEPSLAGAVTLVAGTTVGAGILALPAVTQPVGFVPSSAALILCWLYMATTGLLIAEVALADMRSSGKVATSLQSMAARTIGPIGAVLASVSFVIVHCGLIVAYLARGGELLAAALPGGLPVGLPPPVVFALVFGGLVFATKDSDALEAANNAFALVVLVSFAALVLLAVPSAEPGRLFAAADWGRTSEVVPTLLLSLVFHNVVPTVCAQLEGDRRKITVAIVLGSFLPLLMFLVWNGVILAATVPGRAGGADPLDALRESGGAALAAGVLTFSLSAIVTSFIGFVVALTDFFADAFRQAGEAQDAAAVKLRDFSLALGPPLAVACYDPSLFFQALDKAGAFGVSLLFGLLPAWMALAQRSGESPVLLQQPGLLGGYPRGPLAPGGVAMLALVAVGALGVVFQNATELFQ